MKKSIYILSGLLLSSGYLFAQSQHSLASNDQAMVQQQHAANHLNAHDEKSETRKSAGNEVPDFTMRKFRSEFGNAAIIRSQRLPEYDEVVFNNSEGLETHAFYDENADLIGTTHVASYKELRKTAKKDIEKHYPGYSKELVMFFQDNPDNDSNISLWGSPCDDANFYFVELRKGTHVIVLKSDEDGEVTYFATMAK